MIGWEPIETAPKDGSLVLCCWSGRSNVACLLVWKTNWRINKSYFGDPDEHDDYDLVEPENWPTHWFPYPEISMIQRERLDANS